MRNKILATPIFLILMLASCVSTYQPESNNKKSDYASIYNPSGSNIQPQVRCYHVSENKSYVFFKVNPVNLMPEGKGDSSKLKLGVHYAFRDSENRKIKDSSRMIYNLSYKEDAPFVTYFPVDLNLGSNYFGTVIFMDLNRKSGKKVLLDVNKTSKTEGGFYFPEVIFPEKNPVFNNYMSGNRAFKISSDIHQTDNFYLKKYETDSILPAPPYYTSEDKAKFVSLDTITEFNKNDSIIPENEGFYVITSDSSKNNGFSFYYQSSFFPWVRLPEDMLGPIRYVSSRREYKKIHEEENLKLGIDKFWVNLAGSQKKAKELIRIYYNRVQLANKFFTSEYPGWRTDRGMVYIIFGTPHKVEKDGNRERWSYGARENYQGIVFKFVRKDEALSNNSFEMIRDVRYKEAWTKAIKAWKGGYAYSVE